MLCRSIIEKGFDNVVAAIEGAEMAEIRIEETNLNVEEVKKLFALHNNLLATCRPANLSNAERTSLLEAAIEAGAKWVDIEIESDSAYTQHLVDFAKARDCKVIISYHNYDETPKAKELDKIVDESVAKGADLIKLACQINAIEDNGRLMCLYAKNNAILAIGMGELGMITRIAALKMGAPFTFARGNALNESAPGQLNEKQMNDILSHL